MSFNTIFFRFFFSFFSFDEKKIIHKFLFSECFVFNRIKRLDRKFAPKDPIEYDRSYNIVFKRHYFRFICPKFVFWPRKKKIIKLNIQWMDWPLSPLIFTKDIQFFFYFCISIGTKYSFLINVSFICCCCCCYFWCCLTRTITIRCQI